MIFFHISSPNKKKNNTLLPFPLLFILVLIPIFNIIICGLKGKKEFFLLNRSDQLKELKKNNGVSIPQPTTLKGVKQ